MEHEKDDRIPKRAIDEVKRSWVSDSVANFFSLQGPSSFFFVADQPQPWPAVARAGRVAVTRLQAFRTQSQIFAVDIDCFWKPLQNQTFMCAQCRPLPVCGRVAGSGP